MSNAVLHILLALARQDLHGYGIMKEVKAISEGTYRMGPGTLYDNLTSLLRDGLVEEVSSSNESEPRRTYHLAPKGADAVREELRRLGTIVSSGRKRLQRRTDSGAAQ